MAQNLQKQNGKTKTFQFSFTARKRYLWWEPGVETMLEDGQGLHE